MQHPEGSAAASKLCNQERAGLRMWHLQEEEEQNLCRHRGGSASPAFVCLLLILCPLTLSSLTMWPNLPHLPNTYLLHCIAKDKEHKLKIHLWHQSHCCGTGERKDCDFMLWINVFCLCVINTKREIFVDKWK